MTRGGEHGNRPPGGQFDHVVLPDAADVPRFAENRSGPVVEHGLEFLVQVVDKGDGLVVFQDLFCPLRGDDLEAVLVLQQGAGPGMIVMGMGQQRQMNLFLCPARRPACPQSPRPWPGWRNRPAGCAHRGSRRAGTSGRGGRTRSPSGWKPLSVSPRLPLVQVPGRLAFPGLGQGIVMARLISSTMRRRGPARSRRVSPRLRRSNRSSMCPGLRAPPAGRYVPGRSPGRSGRPDGRSA